MKSATLPKPRSCECSSLEPRRLCAATITAVFTDDRVLEITGTRRSDDIAILEHFPGIGIYDIFANGGLFRQFGIGLSPHSFRITGGGGNDELSVAANVAFPAVLLGGRGNDTLSGAAGNDKLDGGPGRDVLTGNAGNDTLFGRNGADSLTGGDGDDVLNGGGGRDTLSGEAGNDSVIGGPARDAITGGTGADVFSGRDRDAEITDLLIEDSRQ